MERGPFRHWLERNPKKTIFFLLLVVAAGLALITEKWLAWKAGPNHNLLGVKRAIQLREHEPLYANVLVPSELSLETADNLVRKSYLMRVDDNGFLMPSKIYDDPQLSLVFLGGSTTECLYVDEEHRFPYLAGRLLEKKAGLRVNSYNSGRAGNDSLHSLDILLNKVIPLKPDIVVMMHNVNDLSILLNEKTYWNKNPSRRPIVGKKPTFKTVMKNFEENFHLIRDLTIPLLSQNVMKFFRSVRGDEFRQKRGRKKTIDQAYLLDEFGMNLQTFINICRARRLTPVLMTQASRLKTSPDALISGLMKKFEMEHGIPYQEYKEIFDLFNQAIRDLGAKNGVCVVDLAKQVPQEREYLLDLVHLNDRGSQYAAGIIADNLTPLLKSRLLSVN